MLSSRRTYKAACHQGFTLLELMLAVSIMTVIVIGLYTVFDQTQKALRNSIAQVDVLEGVRATGDLLERELEGISYVSAAGYTNLYIARNPTSVSLRLDGPTGDQILATVLQDIFFHTRVGEQWTGIGFWVGPMNTNATPPIALGRLYRFSTNITAAGMAGMTSPEKVIGLRNGLLSAFNSQQRMALSSPVLDGVVHLRVIAYREDGAPLFPVRIGPNSPRTYLDLIQDQFKANGLGGLGSDWRLASTLEPLPGESVRYEFYNRSYPTHPASLELEIGVLERQLITRYMSIPVEAEARKFLARNAGQIHLFRQRIPLRNTPPI